LVVGAGRTITRVFVGNTATVGDGDAVESVDVRTGDEVTDSDVLMTDIGVSVYDLVAVTIVVSVTYMTVAPTE